MASLARSTTLVVRHPAIFVPGCETACAVHQLSDRSSGTGGASYAVGASTDHLDRVVDVHEALAGSDSRRPTLNWLPGDLNRAPASSTHEMMMVVIGVATAIERLAVLGSTAVNLARVGQGAKLVVHRGQADSLATCSKLGMKVLSAQEPVSVLENG